MTISKFTEARNVFIITSALSVSSGVLTKDERLTQTFETVRSIRDRVPGAAIMLVDSSESWLEPTFDRQLDVDLFMQVGPSNPGLQIVGRAQKSLMNIQHEGNIKKSLSETYILLCAFLNLQTMLPSATLKRIFKISGRYKLSEGFNAAAYDDATFTGKFAFLRRKIEPYGGCYETRLWSVCASRLSEMAQHLINIYNCVLNDSVDTERAYFKQLSQTGCVEIHKAYVEGAIAANGCYHSE